MRWWGAFRSAGEYFGLVVTLAATGCLASQSYPCTNDTQCADTEQGRGICLEGWCAYEDDSCEREWRYSANAGGGRASLCFFPEEGTGSDGSGVPTQSTTNASVSATSPSTAGGNTSVDPTLVPSGGLTSDSESSSTTPIDSCLDGCKTPPGPCYESAGFCDESTDTCLYDPLSAGVSCDDADACTGASSCDGAGGCSGPVTVTCTTPPSSCYGASGSCNPSDGLCGYTPLTRGTTCNDGTACTVGDTCDGAGACAAGPTCPSSNPCVSVRCQAGSCVSTPVGNGSSCGAVESLRCCGGSCVDISADEANCGGCGLGCAPGRVCESVAATNTCGSAPTSTSGRCQCATSDAECPSGQICRTFAPFINRCTPNSAGDCPAGLQIVNSCPDYCFY